MVERRPEKPPKRHTPDDVSMVDKHKRFLGLTGEKDKKKGGNPGEKPQQENPPKPA
ncbi:MAG TPA: hypothetical protein VNA13_00965 [Xanthomonadales bacterium]|nr:hypothetical protein [Xanthomonadales bacterium]